MPWQRSEHGQHNQRTSKPPDGRRAEGAEAGGKGGDQTVEKAGTADHLPLDADSEGVAGARTVAIQGWRGGD